MNYIRPGKKKIGSFLEDSTKDHPRRNLVTLIECFSLTGSVAKAVFQKLLSRLHQFACRPTAAAAAAAPRTTTAHFDGNLACDADALWGARQRFWFSSNISYLTTYLSTVCVFLCVCVREDIALT